MRPASWCFALLVIVYALTANWGSDHAWNDTAAASVGAYSIATTGTPVIEDQELADRMPWIVEDRVGRPVPDRFPGLMYVAAPIYLLAPERLTLAPATAVAVLTTAAGAVLLGFSLRRRHGTAAAVATTLAIGLATPAWGIASVALWPHGPLLLWLGLACLALSRDRPTLAGLALGAAVFSRPHLALLPAVAGIYLALVRRSWRPLLEMAASLWGAAAYLGYNRLVFGAWTLTGGYGDAPTRTLSALGPLGYLREVAAGTVSPARGFLVHTPLVLGVAAPKAWSRSDDWLRALTLGAMAYVAFTWAANDHAGGLAQETYRYALELVALLIMVAVPALMRSAPRWMMAAMFGVGVAVQCVAVLADGPYPAGRETLSFVAGDWAFVPSSLWVVGALAGVIVALVADRALKRVRA